MNETTIHDSMPFAALTLGQAKQVICGLIAQELKKITTRQKCRNPM